MKQFHDITDPEIARLLNAGAVAVIPTDTVYGIVACANNPIAAQKVLAVKGRKLKPGTIIAASPEQIIALGIAAHKVKAVEKFWPGAVSVVLPMKAELEYLHSGALSLPFRIPDNKELRDLLHKTGPLATTSANMPDEKTAETIQEAIDIFGDNIDVYVDGGPLRDAKPSTIVKMTNGKIEILRQGAVTIDAETGKIINDV